MIIPTALIGKGYWGSILKRYLEENRNFGLKYIMNSKSPLSEALNDGEIKAVVVASPNETHYPIVKMALLSGKHVLSEKPLAMKESECRELKEIAHQNKLSLVTEYTQTFSPSLEKALNMLQKGTIGDLLCVEMSVRHLGRFGGGSVYWLLASHMLSVLDMFVSLDQLSFESNNLVTYGGEIETGVISFSGGTISGQIVVSLNYPGKETRIILYGEHGTIIYDPVSQPALSLNRYQRKKWTVASLLPQKNEVFQIDESHNLRYAVEYFHRAIRGEMRDNIDRAVKITAILENLEGKGKYRFKNDRKP